jgi:hypothetical protein
VYLPLDLAALERRSFSQAALVWVLTLSGIAVAAAAEFEARAASSDARASSGVALLAAHPVTPSSKTRQATATSFILPPRELHGCGVGPMVREAGAGAGGLPEAFHLLYFRGSAIRVSSLGCSGDAVSSGSGYRTRSKAQPAPNYIIFCARIVFRYTPVDFDR